LGYPNVFIFGENGSLTAEQDSAVEELERLISCNLSKMVEKEFKK
jgi:hypothetical protein